MRERRCPCGSGQLRDDCDPAEVSLCMWGDCPAIFHRHSNAHKYCPEHQLEAQREANRRHNRKRYTRQKRQREEAAAAAAQERAERQSALPVVATEGAKLC